MRTLFKLSIIFSLLTGLSLAEDLTGTWAFKTTIDATASGEGIKEQEMEVVIEQTGSKVTFTIGTAVLQGKLTGDTLHVKGSYEESGTITKDLTFTVDGDEMSGQGKWSYSDGNGYETSGTEKLEGIRLE